MLRLSSRANKQTPSADHEAATRLAGALDARATAEAKLLEANIQNRDLKTRVAELEGAPAERERAAAKRALESANARLAAARESSEHEQNILRDVVAPIDLVPCLWPAAPVHPLVVVHDTEI